LSTVEKRKYAGFEVFTAVIMKMILFKRKDI
jgi:hypothetical protein